MHGKVDSKGKLFALDSCKRKVSMKTNNKVKVESVTVKTHEGGPAKRISKLLELRRSVLATMLWEDGFYENGQTVASRIASLVADVKPVDAAKLAVETRTLGKLRHVPLLIARAMAPLATHRQYVADVLEAIIQRPDELAEFLSIYWKEKKQPLSAQVKKGLARAFCKFDEYQLGKYNRDNAIKLRDVLFLCHAKPQDKAQEALWKRLVDGTLATPDTWEVALSATAGEDKKAAWERLLTEGKLGGLALLRNLRNFKESGVNEKLVRKALKDMKVERVLPYRFIAAAKYAPNLEPELEEAMFKAIEEKQKIGDKTVLLLDVSGSMDAKVSDKSEISRLDAASGLAILAREIFEDVEVFTFSNDVKRVPSRRGFGLRDSITSSQPHGGTELGKAITEIAGVPYKRLIVFTDEQSHDKVGAPRAGSKAYMVNVANNQHGVGYGVWNHIDGFSESILDYLVAFEKLA